jgi:heterodisulfide reductase subunit D
LHKYNEFGYKKVCPVREHTVGFEPYASRGRNQIARGVLEGDIELSAELAEIAYTCLLCGHCRQACGAIDMDTFQPLIDNPATTKALRADLFAAGAKVPHGVVVLGEAVEKTNNIFGAPVEERADWLTPDIKVAKDADTVFFPGCLASYRNPEIAQATAKILNKAGIEFSIMGEEEQCCGNPLVMTGQLQLARETMRYNYEHLKDKRVITSCPGCYRCFEHEYPKLLGEDYKLNTYHTVEIITELIEDGDLKFKKKGKTKEKVTYHDPCELGRDMKVFDEPRIILDAIPGIQLVELERNREKTWCCGGGGVVKAVNFDLAVDIGKDKVEEALATGAKRIISACPACKTNINDAIKAAGVKNLKAIDITELVLESL